MSVFAFTGPGELWVVLIIALVVFGGSQLPKLARNLGRAQRELQQGMSEGAGEADSSNGSTDTAS